MKGINAFSAMSGVDDRFVMASLLPADAPGVASASAKVRKQEKDNWFTRMTSSGWFAAAVSLVVAFGVLAGIVAAGRMAPQNPSHGPGPSSGFPAGTLQNMPESEHDESNDPSEDGSDIPVETSPVFDDPVEPQKGPVAVISDGITVYPEGYCVYFSEMWRDENGDLNGLEGDGPGAVYQLGDIWDSLPTLRTAGNDFELVLPDHMTLRSVRVFEMVEVQTKIFEEIHSTVDGPNVSADPMGYLSTLRGFYTVVLEVYHETNYSEDEYTKGVEEYAFKLDVDPNLDITFPVRMLIDGRTHYLEGKDGINSGHALTELASSVRTATVTRETDIDFYLAPQGNLQSVTAYDGSFRLMMTDPGLEPLVSLPAWAEGDYYFVFTVSFPFEGVSMTLEYPFHIKLVEKTAEETYPNDVGETPEPPRVTVGTNYGGLDFGNTSHSREYHEGYMLWTEQWYDGGMVSGDGPGATGQLSDIAAGLPALRHNAGEEPYLRVIEDEDTLTRIYVYRDDQTFHFDATEAHVLSTLSAGRYIIVLRVTTRGDYIEEVEAYECTCTEYAFILEVYNP